MSPSTLLTALTAAFGDPACRSHLYHRYCLERPGLFAQILLLIPGVCDMNVQVDKEVLDVDFGWESTRPDVPGVHRPRPGLRLGEHLNAAIAGNERQVLFNGNNVGYWGNQFVIDHSALVFKSHGRPIFDDDGAGYADRPHTFFCWSDGGFTVEDIELSASRTLRPPNMSVSASGQRPLPDAGLSGFPLVRDRTPVWDDHRAAAWDPNLLYAVGRMTGVRRADAVRLITERSGEPLVRHPITAVGVDRAGYAVVLVAEQSSRSDGLSVAEAAEMLLDFGATDAVALGAAGDAQLATTDEGFLTAPLVAAHVRHCARSLGRQQKSGYLTSMAVRARPVPCLVSIGHRGVSEATMIFPVVSTGRHALRAVGQPAELLSASAR